MTALAGLGAVAVAVAFILPRYVASDPNAATTSGAATPPRTTPDVAAGRAPDVEPAEPEQPEADALRAEALRRLARLENDGARIWAGETVDDASLAAAEALIATAKELQGQRKDAGAAQIFRESIAMFERLAASKPARLTLALERGRAALAERYAERAQSQLAIAAALAPDDPAIARQLARAHKLPAALHELASGEAAEAANDLVQARNGYRAALGIDPELDVASEKLRRVEAALAARDYGDAVSDAYARLNQGNLDAAEAALARARAVNPKAPEVEDLRQKIAVASRLATLERLRIQAEGFERQEKWSDAVKTYERALAIDKHAAFAERARTRATLQSELHAAIDSYLADPTRLWSADSLAHARSLMTHGGPIADGPALVAKKQQLARQIELVRMPVAVTIQSDNNTDVEIYRVGKLGKFDVHRVELRPGRYVAVGSREGYRDVRVPFEVAPTTPDQTIAVRCTEPIR